MGTKITMNAVLECRNQVAAKRILMEAMNCRLLSYFCPVPNDMWGDDLKQWKLNNWGDYTEPNFDAGWMMNNSVLLKIHGGSPEIFNRMIKNQQEIESYTLNYMGCPDEYSYPDFSGIWLDGQLVKEDTTETIQSQCPF